ncbi:MAG: PH domain-containing protein [Proteobacteria bacterium]|nr:PH domain-containing protein [Pseudomonadota bacterium]
MNSTDNKLTQNEAIIYRAKCHWAILLGPILVIIIGGLALRSQGYHAMVLVAFGLVWGIFSYIRLSRTEIGLTRNKVLISAGFLINKSYDIQLNEIMVIDYYQPSLGSMLNFGKIMIVYNGKKKCALRFVSCPAEFVKEIQQQIIALSPSSTAKKAVKKTA